MRNVRQTTQTETKNDSRATKNKKLALHPSLTSHDDDLFLGVITEERLDEVPRNWEHGRCYNTEVTSHGRCYNTEVTSHGRCYNTQSLQRVTVTLVKCMRTGSHLTSAMLRLYHILHLCDDRLLVGGCILHGRHGSLFVVHVEPCTTHGWL